MASTTKAKAKTNGSAPRKVTEYRVLVEAAEDQSWLVVGDYQVSGGGAPTAKRRAAEDHGSGVYVAVPLRSWDETEFEPETRTFLHATPRKRSEIHPGQTTVDEMIAPD